MPFMLVNSSMTIFHVSEFRYGKEDQIFGLNTALGWTLWGVNHIDQNNENIKKF